MAKPRSTQQDFDSEIIDLVDIVEEGSFDPRSAKGNEFEEQIADLLKPSDLQEDGDIMDLDALLAETEAKDTVSTGLVPDLAEVRMPDLNEVDALLSEDIDDQAARAASNPEELDFAAELDSLLAESPINTSTVKNTAETEPEIYDLDGLLSSISPPETAETQPAGTGEEDIDIDDLDSLLDSIMNPEVGPRTVDETEPDPVENGSHDMLFEPEAEAAPVQLMDFPNQPIIQAVDSADLEPAPASDMQQDIRALQEQMSALQAKMTALAGAGDAAENPALDELLARLDKIQTEVQEMAETNALGLAAAEARISALETELAVLATAASSENSLVDLDARLSSLEASLAEKDDTSGLADRLGLLEAQIAGQDDTREQELTVHLDEFESRLTQTLDARLAALNGLVDLDSRLSSLEVGLTEKGDASGLTDRLGLLEARLGEQGDAQDQALTARLGELENRLTQTLDSRLSPLEADLSEKGNASGLADRLGVLEAKLGEQDGMGDRELDRRFDEFENKQTQALEAKLASLSSLVGLDARLSALEADLTAKGDFAGLADRIGVLENAAAPNLEDRLAALESRSTSALEARLSALEAAGIGQAAANTEELEARLLILERKIAADDAVAAAPTMDLEQRLSSLDVRLRDMEANIEKAAAASAAKVIREELSNLLADQNN